MDTHKRPPAYTQDSAGILQNLRTSSNGLTSQEAQRRLALNGPNELAVSTKAKNFINRLFGRRVNDKIAMVKVRRDGKAKKIPADQLVIGDIVHLHKGDIVPAEIRLIKTDNLSIQNNNFIKRDPIKKDAEAILPENSSIDERINMAYSSAIVKKGSGIGIVTATSLDQEAASVNNPAEDYNISII
ncbi:magnesium-transporting ATPase (P-type) [Lactobacillus colini]|uniref:Magnesium-transporting ATPase (P-type) n=1 Tax=Lactobacillus colini TaxID=1819254 RepID=A0ABS4MEH7_9LACO|nr:cation-transporting P-type ATPase [Lactobacillus colini]MBP2058087.1 magnesium-transporting ATPase (P-type) [Lactobacillus colini]